MYLNKIYTKYQKEDINQKNKKEEVFIELLKDYSSIVFEAKYRRIY